MIESGSILAQLGVIGYEVVESPTLPFTFTGDDGIERRTDYVIDRVARKIIASPAVVKALQKVGC